MFKINQKVVALVSHFGIVKGNVYVVNGIIYCSSCGDQKISVGNLFPKGYKGQYCGKCYEKFRKRKELFYASNRFAPIEEISDTTVEQFLQTIFAEN